MLNLTYIDATFIMVILMLTSFTAGMMTTLFFTSKGVERSKIQQRTFGMSFISVWVTFQGYVSVTNGEPLNWFFNASGFIAVGYIFGMNVGEYLTAFKK